MNYTYQSEKLSVARHRLMLPHSKGEAQSVIEALHECAHAFHNLDRDSLEDDPRRWIFKIEEYMGVTGFGETPARELTTDEKIELSNTIDELAHWFERHYWSN